MQNGMKIILNVLQKIFTSCKLYSSNQRNGAKKMERQILETIENALIDRMAKEAGVQRFQMKSMIMRCEELKQYYKRIRSIAIKDLAENFGKTEAA